MIEMKNCPFCKGKANVASVHICAGAEIGEAFCTQCGARISTREFETEEEAKQKAIELWNNRVVDTSTLSSLGHEMYDEWYWITAGGAPPTPMLNHFALGKVSQTILRSIGEKV